ncbi:hypothetical protein B0T25DRAFT_535252 [Lasiosphaeria hispida]|uniref:Enoyl reductase (ER) domain-containing protein n=1 Tax=Lasiosphaeria hispida TaxID=260671 RepID=A0AAJ0HS56_9PEZI|nr:hypothetical protein B0T25DRAFT_535252 [Lasiosphaeria hispida]
MKHGTLTQGLTLFKYKITRGGSFGSLGMLGMPVAFLLPPPRNGRRREGSVLGKITKRRPQRRHCSFGESYHAIPVKYILVNSLRALANHSPIDRYLPITDTKEQFKMAETMRAIDIHGGSGPATALFLNPSTPKPVPGAGQVLVRISAFGLNRMDLFQREGRYALPPQAPSTLGVEFSGTVAASNATAASSFRPGDEVFGLAYGGAYAEYVAVSAKTLLHKPVHLSFEQAAALPETWITATQALHFVLGITEGKSVLWHAGASGVSIAGIQLSRLAGASEVYATAGSQEKCEFIERELGATKAFNYKEEDWAAEILAKTGGKGVDLIVDFVGADYFNKNLDVVARDGRICLLGLMSGGVVDQVNIGKLLYKRARVEGSTLRSRDEDYQGLLRDKLEEYLPKFESGELKIFIDTVLPFEEIVKAHQQLEENKTMGKIICTIS